MSEPFISEERLEQIHAERPSLVVQDDEFQRLALALSRARAERDAARDENARAWKIINGTADAAAMATGHLVREIRDRDAALTQVSALRRALEWCSRSCQRWQLVTELEILMHERECPRCSALADTAAAAQSHEASIRREERAKVIAEYEAGIEEGARRHFEDRARAIRGEP